MDAGANWDDQRGRNRVVALRIVATWACCWRMSAEHDGKRGARKCVARAAIGTHWRPHCRGALSHHRRRRSALQWHRTGRPV